MEQLIEDSTEPILDEIGVFLDLSGIEDDKGKTIKSPDLYLSLRILSVWRYLLNQLFNWKIHRLIQSAALIYLMDQNQSLVLQYRRCILHNVLKELLDPYGLVSLILNLKECTASSLITLETFCLIEILASPSFSTITETRLDS